MLQKSQRTKATQVGSKLDAWGFPEELPGNSIDPAGSGYPHPIWELSSRDSASALSSKDIITFQIHAGGFWVLIWQTLLAFLFLAEVFFLAY